MPSICSLFSGIGGIDLGFVQAGFDVAWVNEMDSAACKTYRHNFPHAPLVEADIRKIHVKDIPDFDVLTAGFPCQPFSIAGYKRDSKIETATCFLKLLVLLTSNDRKWFSWKTFRILLNMITEKPFL